MPLSDNRKAQIAMAVCEYYAIQNGVDASLRQKLGNMAEKMKRFGFETTTDELVEFHQGFVAKLLGVAYNSNSVSVTVSNGRKWDPHDQEFIG